MDVLSRSRLFERTIADAAREHGVDPRILWVIGYNETRFRPWLTSPKDARGLMQFIPATAARFGLIDAYEPTSSIHAAARYVKYLGKLFGGRVESILAAYNSGEGTVLAYLHGRTLSAGGRRINPIGRRTAHGIPPYRETINYVANGKRIYRWLEDNDRFPEVRKGSRPEAESRTAISESEPTERKSLSNSSTMVVLYDPRTGSRYEIKENHNMSLLEREGPIIISPDVLSLPTRSARTTFAGISRTNR
ncbi:MAG: lytic transglycosylase domain-containing protein [Acidobacteria bacterium]|jgi:hypothetical protein|nr:lytic transglycosylase domain-containing protein [Acidobacteriota bacterium]